MFLDNVSVLVLGSIIFWLILAGFLILAKIKKKSKKWVQFGRRLENITKFSWHVTFTTLVENLRKK